MKAGGLISFCFIDPYAANLRFNTIRALSRYKMDFLIVLMLGTDIRRNFQRYYEDISDTRIADLIDSPNWREEYRPGENVIGFILRKFNQAMTRLDYQPVREELIHQVKIAGKNVPLYSLVLYSRHELALKFWRQTLRQTDPQLGLGLDA